MPGAATLAKLVCEPPRSRTVTLTAELLTLALQGRAVTVPACQRAFALRLRVLTARSPERRDALVHQRAARVRLLSPLVQGLEAIHLTARIERARDRSEIGVLLDDDRAVPVIGDDALGVRNVMALGDEEPA